MTSVDVQRPGQANAGGDRFLIHMKPNGKLPLVLSFRPSRAQEYSFLLPLTLYSKPAAAINGMVASNMSTSGLSSNVGAGRKPSLDGNNSGSLNGSLRLPLPPGAAVEGGDTVQQAAVRVAAASEVMSCSSSGRQPIADEGRQVPDVGCPAAALVATEAAGAQGALSVPVYAVGLQPRLVVSKTVLEFGSKVILHGNTKKKPYALEISLRNNTESNLEVRGGLGDESQAE